MWLGRHVLRLDVERGHRSGHGREAETHAQRGDTTLVILVDDDALRGSRLRDVGTLRGRLALRVEVLECSNLRQVGRLRLKEIRRVSAKADSGLARDVVLVGTRRGARHGTVAGHTGEQRARVTEAGHLRGVVGGDVVRESHESSVLSQASRHCWTETSTMAARCFVTHTSSSATPAGQVTRSMIWCVLVSEVMESNGCKTLPFGCSSATTPGLYRYIRGDRQSGE